MRANKKYQNINELTEEHAVEANQEVVKNWQKKHKTTVDEDYKYIIKNPFVLFWMACLRFLALIILVPFNYFIQHMRMIGKRNFRKARKKGCIIVNNHCALLDSVMIASSLSKSKTVHQVSIKSNFDVPFAGRMIRWLGSIPLPNENPRAMRQFMKAVEEMLSKKRIINICPEGSLWPEYRGLRTFRLGAFHFACKCNKPIVPVVYTFTRRKTKFTHKEKPVYNIKMHILPAEYPDNSLDLNLAKKELAERVFDRMADKLKDIYGDVDDLIWKEKYTV